MKKLLCLLSVFGLCFGLCGCSSSDEGSKDPQGSTIGEKKETVLEEQVIYEENDIKVTATGLDFIGFFGPSIKVLIENNSSSDIMLQAQYCTVNNLMVDTIFSANVAAGKKANDTITLDSNVLEAANVSTIKEIQLVLNVIDAETWYTVYSSEPITLKTSSFDGVEQQFDDSGVVAIDEDNFKIVFKKLDSKDSFLGTDIYLYLENNSGTDVIVQVENVSVNGFMIEPVFSCDVVSGKKAFDTITFFQSDLENNNIEEINEMELEFEIFDANSWNTIKHTSAIKVMFE